MPASLDRPARLLLSFAVLAAGALLIFAPLTVQRVALITGIGIAVAGLVLIIHAPDRASPHAPTRWAGVTLIVIGAFMSLWPDAGAPWLAHLVAAALVLHGVSSAVNALRKQPHNQGDVRAASVFTALATLLIGVLAFSWPVLTLSIFRYGVGIWFVFLGLQLLFTTLRRQTPLQLPPTTPKPENRATKIRRWSRTIASAVALLLAAGAAYGSGLILGGAPLPEPGKFYEVPETVPADPGQLIRSEPLTAGVPAGAKAWKILYTTTHSNGSAAVSSGTIMAPGKASTDPLPLISVAHGTTGVVAKCAPSLSATPFADGAGTALEEMVVKHGWAAVTSDYIGLGTAGVHPYLVGDAEARNVLDASLAARQFSELQLTSKTVVWGHSQGGQGALWTGQIANDYAPELEVAGIAAFAPAADLYGLANSDKNDAAGKTVSAYIASTWNEVFPKLELSKNLTPGSAGGVAKIEDLCFNGNDVLAAILRGTQIPNQVFPDQLLHGDFGDRLKEQTPVGPFPAPVMVAQGLADPLVKPAMQHDWVEARCRAGEKIDYRTYPGLSHNTLVAADSPLTPQIVKWTLDRWASEAPTPNCGDLPN